MSGPVCEKGRENEEGKGEDEVWVGRVCYELKSGEREGRGWRGRGEEVRRAELVGVSQVIDEGRRYGDESRRVTGRLAGFGWRCRVRGE